MFFFIGGIQPKTVIADRLARSCPMCGHSMVYLKRVDQYLSLFFIPLFPVKRGTPFLVCEKCHSILDEKDLKKDFKKSVWERRCSGCGKRLERDSAFCPYCGKDVDN